MAGQAPYTSETSIPASKLSVSSAAPLAIQPKTLSGNGLCRLGFGGGEVLMIRLSAIACPLVGAWLAGSVDDTRLIPV